jgi:hypothetical protein
MRLDPPLDKDESAPAIELVEVRTSSVVDSDPTSLDMECRTSDSHAPAEK